MVYIDRGLTGRRSKCAEAMARKRPSRARRDGFRCSDVRLSREVTD